jgi:hypothetical protein
MKILIGTGASEPEQCAAKCAIRGFKRLGHEVCVAGPVYGRNDISIPTAEAVDIDLPDKPYPETYTYKEILDKAPWTPDFILQIEPHFYFTGEKPKDIPSYYWILDPHRGGLGHRDMALEGNFNAVLITQPFFVNSYSMKKIKAYWVAQAYDDERVQHDPLIQPECDLAFIGETGIHEDLLKFDKHDLDGFYYTDTLPDQIIPTESKEYAERAQLLGYLMEDFNVRIYERNVGGYSKILQKGEVGFNRSLFLDINLRVFEIMACKRLLITDIVPHLDRLLQPLEHYLPYGQFGFDPFNPNFKLDYEQVKEAFDFALNNTKRDEIAQKGYECAIKDHTYKRRAEQIVEIIRQDE